jgi:hypothetical protein
LADSWIIYREIENKNNVEILQKYLNTFGEWEVEN